MGQSTALSHFARRLRYLCRKTDTIMFAFDNVLEYWTTKYKRIKHDPAAKSKDKRYDK